MVRLLAKARELCAAHKARLLFLTVFGARLYGTEVPGRSDVDVRGVFAPEGDSDPLDAARPGIHYSTNPTLEGNLPQDTDIDLISVQRWLLEQLPQGHIGGLDILFAPSRPACTLYCDPALEAVFASPLRLLDTVNSRGYATYSLGQGKKYGLAGTRLGAFKAAAAFFQALSPAPDGRGRLGDYLADLVAACGQNAHCGLELVADEAYLRLGNKLHAASTPLPEFLRRLDRELAGHAQSLAAAARGEVDFKALSHALRALYQMEELFTTGQVVFPLKRRAEIRAVKQGAYGWPELEKRILAQLARVDELRMSALFCGRHERAFAEQCVLACYAPCADK